MKDTVLELTEIFHSLQGEGPFSGQPATFVRLSGCIQPLCPWCDTMYSCGSGTPVKLHTIQQKIQRFNSSLVVITGGEPFLQWHTGLRQLEQQLLGLGYQVQYETGGKIEIPADTQGYSVCSPKFIEDRWVFIETNLGRAHVFKFVVDNDYDEVKTFIQRFSIPPDKVYIMPKGTTREEQLDRFPTAWAFCMENGFCFSPRLHVLAFNDKRGV